jgi:hypothetical protein
MTTPDPRQAPITQPLDDSAAAPSGGTGGAPGGEPGAPAPAPASAPEPAPAAGGDLAAQAVPAVPSGGAAPIRARFTRRRVVIGAAGVGVAVLFAGVGFFAGTQLSSRGDVARFVPAPDWHGHSYWRAGPGWRLPGDGVDGWGQGDVDPRGSVFVTSGRVTAIDGSALTLVTFQGLTVKVTTTSSTAVAGASGGDLSKLAVGQRVIVSGTRASDGTYSATAIMTAAGWGQPGVGSGHA